MPLTDRPRRAPLRFGDEVRRTMEALHVNCADIERLTGIPRRVVGRVTGENHRLTESQEASLEAALGLRPGCADRMRRGADASEAVYVAGRIGQPSLRYGAPRGR